MSYMHAVLCMNMAFIECAYIFGELKNQFATHDSEQRSRTRIRDNLGQTFNFYVMIWNIMCYNVWGSHLGKLLGGHLDFLTHSFVLTCVVL